MHYNYKLDKYVITNIMKRHIKPIEKQKQIKRICYTEFRSSTLSLRITPTLLKYT